MPVWSSCALHALRSLLTSEISCSPFNSPFSSKVVVCGHCPVTLPLTINETLKWLSSLPVAGGDDVTLSGVSVPPFPGSQSPPPPPPSNIPESQFHPTPFQGFSPPPPFRGLSPPSFRGLSPPPPAPLSGVSFPDSVSPERTGCVRKCVTVRNERMVTAALMATAAV